MTLHVPDGSGGLRPVGGPRAVEPVASQRVDVVAPTVMRPMTRSGATSYPVGRWEEIVFGLLDGVPDTADVDGRLVAPQPRDALPADVLRLLERYSSGRRVEGALVVPGSASWTLGMKVIRVRTMTGGRASITDHRIQVI